MEFGRSRKYVEGGCWSRHAYVYGPLGSARSLVERCSEEREVVSLCCFGLLYSHCSSRRCGRAPAAPPLK